MGTCSHAQTPPTNQMVINHINTIKRHHATCVYRVFPSHKSMTLRTNKYIAFFHTQSIKMQLARAIQKLHALEKLKFQNKNQMIFTVSEFTASF